MDGSIGRDAHRETAVRRGSLLVASPEMTDPNFAETVVLMLDVDDGEPWASCSTGRPR
ncbi:hypothetical protein [Nocardioides houyundeii]|uniref:hypothetical protein n=1 Tax=Nocardioides houyundeii TaxID=2045452 RepID=UPI0030D1BF98